MFVKIKTITLMALAFQFVVNCQSSDQMANSPYNPLGQPGGAGFQPNGTNSGSFFKAGSYVTTGANSTAFFASRPTDGTTAELLLPAGTMMRVVKSDASFTRVELDDGKLGFVATATLFAQDSSSALPSSAAPNMGGGVALPPSSVNPAIGLPPSSVQNGIPTPPVTSPPLPNAVAPLPPSSNELPPSSAEKNR